MTKNKSLLKFFLIIYGLSIPLWIIERFIDIKGLPLNIPITDILAAFTPLIAATILVYKDAGKTGKSRYFNGYSMGNLALSLHYSTRTQCPLG
jgi:uncharacterized protein